ncbi:hypothetical protein CCP1ISM_330002 [Azospirillaceae bacterium]
MKFRKDGSIISSNSLAGNASQGGSLSPSDMKKVMNSIGKANEVHLVTIREIYYVDDIKNKSKYQVEYNIRVEFGDRHGQEYENVTAVNLYGGMMNISEMVYSPKEQTTKGDRNADDSYMFDHDGSQVVIAFMDGYPNKPFIIGGWNHTNNNVFATKKEDGVRKIEEFNGIRLNINKDGEFILTYYGGKRNSKTKKTALPDTAPTTFKIDKDGSWSVDDKENQLIKISRKDKKITISQNASVKPAEEYGKTDISTPGDLVNSIVLDKTAKSITLTAGKDKVIEKLDGAAEKKSTTYSGGMTVVEDGAAKKITWTMGGTVVTYDGTANKITLVAGSSSVVIDGSSGKIELLGDLVDIGTGASALAVLGPQLVAWLSSHNHIGNLGLPTSAPVVPPPTTMLSTSVKLKT